jgi:hypothetical protein
MKSRRFESYNAYSGVCIHLLGVEVSILFVVDGKEECRLNFRWFEVEKEECMVSVEGFQDEEGGRHIYDPPFLSL